MLTKRKTDLRSDTRENFIAVKNTIRQATAARQGGPLRLDPDKLEPTERVELAALVKRSWSSDGVFDPSLLGRDRGRFERLAEKSAVSRPAR